MGLMDKFKNLFTEEIEEEVEEPIKKEVMQVEIPSPSRRVEEEPKIDIPEEKPMVEETPKQEEYKFPFFDDDDFDTFENREIRKDTRKKSSYRKEIKEVYNPPKEEKKVFKPTPIISPVYGILDQNYQKEDIKKKNEKPRFYYDPKEASVDEIRNKAYGTLEDDIETTLFGKNRDLFEEKEEDINDVILENTITEEEMADIQENNILEEDLIKEKPKHQATNATEPEITDLLEEELGKEDIKEEISEPKEEAEEPRKISDAELFNMIDSMYQKGDK